MASSDKPRFGGVGPFPWSVILFLVAAVFGLIAWIYEQTARIDAAATDLRRVNAQFEQTQRVLEELDSKLSETNERLARIEGELSRGPR